MNIATEIKCMNSIFGSSAKGVLLNKEKQVKWSCVKKYGSTLFSKKLASVNNVSINDNDILIPLQAYTN